MDIKYSEVTEADIKRMTKLQNYECGYKNGNNDALIRIRKAIEEKYQDRPRSYNHFQRTELYREIIKIIDKDQEQTDG